MAGGSPNITYNGQRLVGVTLNGENIVLIPGVPQAIAQFAAPNTYLSSLVTKGAVTVNSGSLFAG